MKQQEAITYTITIVPWSEFQKEVIEDFMKVYLSWICMWFKEHHKKTEAVVYKNQDIIYPIEIKNSHYRSLNNYI